MAKSKPPVERVAQMIPANPGWFARFSWNDDIAKTSHAELRPIAMWLLLETLYNGSIYQHIVGTSPSDFCNDHGVEEQDGFDCYVYDPTRAATWSGRDGELGTHPITCAIQAGDECDCDLEKK